MPGRWSEKTRRDKITDVAFAVFAVLLVGFAVFYAGGYQLFIDQPRVLPPRIP